MHETFYFNYDYIKCLCCFLIFHGTAFTFFWLFDICDNKRIYHILLFWNYR